MTYSIQMLPKSERPRERLFKHGPEALSTVELLAIVLGSGMKGIPVLQLAQEIVAQFGSLERLSEVTIEELCQIRGLGQTKAILLKAAFSLGSRISKQVLQSKFRVDNPEHAYNLVKDELQSEKRELFIVILQDIKGYVIRHQVVSIGTLSSTLVHPREVFYPAIRHKAASLILVHNHPSGDPTPSKQDLDVTKSLIGSGKLMGIPINDHLIIGEKSYVSLRQRGFSFEP